MEYDSKMAKQENNASSLPERSSVSPAIQLSQLGQFAATASSLSVPKNSGSDSTSPFPPSYPYIQLGGSLNRSPSPAVNSMLSGRSPSPALGLSQLSSGRSPSPAPSASGATHSSSASSSHDNPPPAKKRRLFHRELKYMMHGFGDDPNPYSETVDLVEELVVQFVTEMTTKAMEVGRSGRVHVNDIIFIIRKDPKKYSRVRDLLMMKEQIDKAKKAFSEESEPFEL